MRFSKSRSNILKIKNHLWYLNSTSLLYLTALELKHALKYVKVTVFIKFKKKAKYFFLIVHVGLFFLINVLIDKYTNISLSFFLYFLNFINAVTSTLFFPNPIESYHVHVSFLSYFAVYIVLLCMYLNTTCILSYVISMRFIVFSRLFYP